MKQSSDTLTDAPYRDAVGCLMYLAVATRPDITYAVNYVSQFFENPSERHWTMVKRILKYLQGTTLYGFKYNLHGKTLGLIGYSDADFANDPDIRRSVSGVLFKYNDAAIT